MSRQWPLSSCWSESARGESAGNESQQDKTNVHEQRRLGRPGQLGHRASALWVPTMPSIGCELDFDA
jgi:hypothetical protein